MELHPNTDIGDEQLKLQDDIQKIQDTLYDSHSEYDSDDSECLEIDLERNTGSRNASALTVVTDDDTRTRSSIGESSTSHLEAAEEVSEGVILREGLFVINEDQTMLPVNVESTLALNRAYQEVVVDILQQTEQSLAANRKKQEDFELGLMGHGEKNLSVHTQPRALQYRQYSIPYMKDPKGGVPPPNEDVVIKKLLKEHKQDVIPPRDWTVSHKAKLVDAMAEDALQQLLQPIMMKLEVEQEKLEGNKKKGDREIRSRIAALEQELVTKRNTDRSELLLNVDTKKTDWMKISSIGYEGKKSWQECETMWNNVVSPHVNHSEWSREEGATLLKLCTAFKGKNWETIAEKLQTRRTAFQCLKYYQTHLNPDNGSKPWTKIEDEKLLSVVESVRKSGHRLLWSKVSSYLENRSGVHCFNRFSQIDPNMKRGAWSQEEDLQLCAALKLCGLQNWPRICEFVPGRNSMQCRDRWTNSLDPNLTMGNWSYEEDKVVLRLVHKFGMKNWAKIALCLPGRTDNMVLQRYRRLENWERKCKWFEGLPENTKRALLGGHMSEEELKEKEHLNWQTLEKDLNVYKEDYDKQERDRQNGDIVVPRPPPLLGYSTSIPRRIIQSRINLQNIILRHVKFIQDESLAPSPEAHTDTDVTESVEKELAARVQLPSMNNVSVKKLLEISRQLQKNRKFPSAPVSVSHIVRSLPKIVPKKSKFNFVAVRTRRRIGIKLRETVQSLFKMKRRMKKGRPRRFFNKYVTAIPSEEENHHVKIRSLHLIMKALDIDPKQMLTGAATMKQMSQASAVTPATPSPMAKVTPGGRRRSRNKLSQEEESTKTVGGAGKSDSSDTRVDVDLLQCVTSGTKNIGEGEEEILVDDTVEEEEEVEEVDDGADEDDKDIESKTFELVGDPNKNNKGGTIAENAYLVKDTTIIAAPDEREASVKTPQTKDGHVQSKVTSPEKSPKKPQKKTVTFILVSPKPGMTIINPGKTLGGRGASKSAMKSGTENTETSAPGSGEARKISTTTNVKLKEKLTSCKPVITGTSGSASAESLDESAVVSSASSAAKSSTELISVSMVKCVTEEEEKKEEEVEEEVSAPAKTLPLLPPNVTNITAFKTLLLNRHKNVINAGSLYHARSYYNADQVSTPRKPDTVDMDVAEVQRNRGRQATTMSSSTNPAQNVRKKVGETSIDQRMKQIRSTEDYQMLKARFQSLFVWPALISTIHPPFDRRDFSSKAMTVTAGEQEVDSIPQTRTKGYALSRSQYFYQKMVMTRSDKEVLKKTGKRRRRRGDLDSNATTPVNHEPNESQPDVLDESSGLVATSEAATTSVVATTLKDTTSEVTTTSKATTSEATTSEATPAATAEGDTNLPPKKKRGRPFGCKVTPWAKSMPTRSLREKEPVMYRLKRKHEKRKNGSEIKKTSGPKRACRASLSSDLRKSMLESMAAMRDGLMPDPAKGLQHCVSLPQSASEDEVSYVNIKSYTVESGNTKPVLPVVFESSVAKNAVTPHDASKAEHAAKKKITARNKAATGKETVTIAKSEASGTRGNSNKKRKQKQPDDVDASKRKAVEATAKGDDVSVDESSVHIPRTSSAIPETRTNITVKVTSIKSVPNNTSITPDTSSTALVTPTVGSNPSDSISVHQSMFSPIKIHSKPTGNATVPMILAYVQAKDGTMIPTLNPLPVDVIDTIKSRADNGQLDNESKAYTISLKKSDKEAEGSSKSSS